jgi:hypothetical protein
VVAHGVTVRNRTHFADRAAFEQKCFHQSGFTASVVSGKGDVAYVFAFIRFHALHSSPVCGLVFS